MEEIIKPSNYWNKKKCSECAAKCETRSEFKKRYNSAYISSRYNGWLNDICSHMKPAGSILQRFLYIYEFEDGTAYIGLTCDFERRTKDRELSNDRVWIKSQKMKHKIIISDEPFDIEDAVLGEKILIAFYKKHGIPLLNRTNGGELGGG